MEGKSLARSLVLLIGVLFLSQTLVEAQTIKCDTSRGYDCMSICYDLILTLPEQCASTCGCTLSTNMDMKNYPKLNNFQRTGNKAITEEAYGTSNFCKLGCVSSACRKITNPNASAGRTSERQDEAAYRCIKACYQLCDKKSDTEVFAAN